MHDETIIRFRVTVSEKKRLTEIAKSAGLSLTEFVRMAAIKESYNILAPELLRARLVSQALPDAENS